MTNAISNKLVSFSYHYESGQNRSASAGGTSDRNFETITNSGGRTKSLAGATAPSENAGTFISEMDQDGDSLLNSEEMGVSSDVFSRLDTNGDGALDGLELDAGRADKGIMDLMIQNMLSSTSDEDLWETVNTTSDGRVVSISSLGAEHSSKGSFSPEAIERLSYAYRYLETSQLGTTQGIRGNFKVSV